MGITLITGGKGFLGAHLVARLQAQGEDVRVLARPPAGQAPANGEDHVVWGDIRDPQAVDQAMEGVDTVFHLVSNFRKGGSDKHEAHAINVDGTVNVLQAAHKHNVRRLVHCSTIGVHGSVLEIPANEQTAFNPGDLYQETKLIAEQKVWDFYRETGLPISVVRPISMMGPGDRRMLKLFKGIKKGTFVIVGKGQAYFQPAYIDDVVDGFLLCRDHENAVGEVFILGSEEYVTLNELVSTIADELGVQPPRIRVPLTPVLWAASLCEAVFVPLGVEPPLHRRRVSFFQNNRAFSIDKAKSMLGYQPKVSLREALRRTIHWYQQQGWM